MQRKLYNNFYVKPEIYFENFSYKSNDKFFFQYSNKKEMCNQLYMRNKVDDKYPYNLKKVYVGGAGVFVLSSTGVIKCGIGAASSVASNLAAKASAAELSAKSIMAATNETIITELTKAFAAVNKFSKPAIQTAITSVKLTAVTNTISAEIAAGATDAAVRAASTTAWGSLAPYGMVIIALIAVTIIVIILYIWLCKRSKNSWKYEYRKHLCT